MSGTQSRERYRRHAARILEVRATLAARFPACFAKKGRSKRPLAIGIAAALVELCPDIPAAEIKSAIGDYVGGVTYLRNVVAGAARVGLQGEPAGAVSEGQAEYAAGRLRHLEKRIAEQRAQVKVTRPLQAATIAAGAQ